jgi:hypothetical protein
MQPQCQLRNSRKTGSLREGRRKIGAGTSTLLRTAQQNFRTAAYVQINSEWGKGAQKQLWTNWSGSKPFESRKLMQLKILCIDAAGF